MNKYFKIGLSCIAALTLVACSNSSTSSSSNSTTSTFATTNSVSKGGFLTLARNTKATTIWLLTKNLSYDGSGYIVITEKGFVRTFITDLTLADLTKMTTDEIIKYTKKYTKKRLYKLFKTPSVAKNAVLDESQINFDKFYAEASFSADDIKEKIIYDNSGNKVIGNKFYIPLYSINDYFMQYTPTHLYVNTQLIISTPIKDKTVSGYQFDRAKHTNYLVRVAPKTAIEFDKE